MGKFDLGFYKKMLKLAIPIALQNMLSACAVLVDTAMVSGLGNVSISAVSVSGRWNFILELFLFGFCAGAATLIAQYWGMQDKSKIRRTYLVTLLCAGLCSTLLLVATRFWTPQMLRVFTDEGAVVEAAGPYLKILAFGEIFLSVSMVTNLANRAVGEVRIPFVASTVSVLVNVVLNYGLIYGNLGLPALGLRGAALATLVSQICQAILSLGLTALKKSPILPVPGQPLEIDLDFFKKYITVCLPVILNEGLWGLGNSGYAMVLARQGSDNYAAYSIFNNVTELVFVFFVGVCSACGILLGHVVGSGDLEEGYRVGKRAMILTPVMGLVLGIALMLVKTPILGAFPMENQETRQLVSDLLTLYCAVLPLHNIAYTAVVGVFRPGGDTRIGLIMDCFCQYLIGIPTVFVLGMLVRIPFVWLVAAMYLSEDIIKTVFCLWYFRSRKWIRRLTVK